MLQNRLAIGILLGLISAVVILSTVTGPVPMRLILFFVTALPIFLAGLGWGTPAALAAGVTGTLAVSLLGWQAAVIFAVSQALPAAVLSHLVLLSRETPSGPGHPSVIEWYPVGRIVVWSAALAGIPAALWMLFFSGGVDALKATLGPHVTDFVKSQFPPEHMPSEADIATIIDDVVTWLPRAMAVLWMLALIGNLWLAGRIVTASGNFVRPWPDLAAITYPQWTPVLFAVATAASYASGWLGMGATGFAETFLWAYLLLGLAVMHFVSRGNAWRGFQLSSLYASLIILNRPVTYVIALVGLAETLFHLRARSMAGSKPTPPPST